MKRTVLVVLFTTLPLLTGLVIATPVTLSQSPAPKELPPQPPSALRGRAIYNARCARCHGPEGQADGPMVSQLPASPPSFADVDHMRRVTPAGHFNIITNGNLDALMPPWGNELSVQERWDVVAYIWSLSTSRTVVDQGQKLYARQCAPCHGEDGSQVETIDLADLAIMAGLSQADLAQRIRESHADVDWQAALTDDQYWAVADYVRTFTYETAFEAETATGNGAIVGRLRAGTAGVEADFANVPVTVFPFVGNTPLTPITVTAKADGTFRVENLPTDADRSYGVQAHFAGVDYFYPDVITLTDNPTVSVDITVYETTTDDAAIDIERNHIIIDFADGAMRVAELYLFRNSGDRTFVGQDATLRFSLPDGATGLRFDDARMMNSTRLDQNGEVVDTLPVPPGMRQVLLSYSLRYSGRTAGFEKELIYPTANLNVLVAAARGVQVEAADLQAREPVSTQDNTHFLNYTAESLPAGAKIRLQLSNLPRGSARPAAVPLDRSGTLRWLGIALAALGLLFVVAYPSLRPRLLPAEETAEATMAALRQQRQMLLQELADLDDAFEAHGVPTQEYRRQRARLKVQLIDIMQALRHAEEGQT